ncbi:MAG: heme ABC exporter ATP-binding protein CcmA [Gemmatimonadetes bacterium]|nr:heme ABC exporter ATP-binding protein CcmA [Gemmatimonadota bacterium]
MSLEARGVVSSYGPTRALDGVDFAARPGEVTALLGSNGAGKSTLLRILTGERKAETGTVSMDGTPLRRDDPAWRSRISLISHQTGLYRSLTVAENLRFFSRLRGLRNAPDRIEQMLERFGVGGVRRRAVGTLSRGQRQRVALARALLHEPDVLLLDEPYTGLDPSGVAAVTGVLSEQQGRGCIVVLVTHDIAQGLALSARTVVLRGGRKVADAASGECKVAEVTRLMGAAA